MKRKILTSFSNMFSSIFSEFINVFSADLTKEEKLIISDAKEKIKDIILRLNNSTYTKKELEAIIEDGKLIN